MTLKKQSYSADEIALYDDALVYKRGEYWQFRMWLAKERKYARFTLKTRNRSTALEKAKLHYHELMAQQIAGKAHFSLTTKQGVEKYVKQRDKAVAAKTLGAGRLGTIKTHLEHWLDFIGRDTKLRELGRNDCEDYFFKRSKTRRKIAISQTTVVNEQSTINAMMLWLHRQGDTLIDGFDFPRMPRIDRSAEGQRRNTFTREEIAAVANTLERYVVEARRDLDGQGNLTKFVVCYYLLASIITGLRTGEQRQLKWSDIRWNEHKDRQGNTFDLVEITVRAETSKVKKSREFFVQDLEYFEALRTVMWPRLPSKKVADYLVFSTNGRSPLTQRAILYHFHQALDDSDIKNRDVRDLVPYSFRHYFITDRIKAGLSHKQVADICGTSITQIENTYRHIDRETRLTAALADYTVDDAGRIIPKQPVDWS